MRRISQQRMERSFNKRVLDNSNPINVINKKAKHNIFAFDIIAGYITSTENGIRSNNSVIARDYSTFQRVFTGLENILAVWDSSWTIEKKNENDTFLTKTPKVGRSILGYIDNENLSATFEPSAISNDFLAELTDEQFMVQVEEDLLEEDLFKLYIIPSLKEEKWLYISSATKFYNEDKTLHHVDLILQTLNNKIAKSGGAIEQFVQRSAAGEGYTWPVVDNEGNISLDQDKLKDVPITSFQEEYSGAAAFNTMYCYGRPTSYKVENFITSGQFNPKIEAPRLLLPYELETPIPSPLNTRPSAEGNWYTGMFTPTLWASFNDWKKQFEASYDITQRAEYEGVLKSLGDKNSITKSNPIANGSYDKILWDTEWKPEIDYNFPTVADDKTGARLQLQGQFSIPQMFAHQYFATSYLETLPLQVEQNTVWRATDIPIIGGFLNKITFGVPLGWNNKAIKLQAEAVWLLAPTSIVEYGSTLMQQTDKVAIPLETFTGNRKDDATNFSGINATGSIMKVSLTDRFQKTINGRGYIFNTVDLGQDFPTHDNNGTAIVWGTETQATKLLWDETCIPYRRKVDGYVIDFADNKTIAKLSYRRTFFSNDIQAWTGTYQSRSLFTGSIRDWNNPMKMSFWQEQNNRKVSYPKDIVSPKPPSVNNPVIDIKNWAVSFQYPFFTIEQLEDLRVLKKEPFNRDDYNITTTNQNVINVVSSTIAVFDTTDYGGITAFRNNYLNIQISGTESFTVDINNLIQTGGIDIPIQRSENHIQYFNFQLESTRERNPLIVNFFLNKLHLRINGNLIEAKMTSNNQQFTWETETTKRQPTSSFPLDKQTLSRNSLTINSAIANPKPVI